MPDASGRIRGTGWSRRAEAAFDRLHSNAVPSEPPPEVETWLADRSDAEDNWPVDAYDQRRSAWRTCD